MIMLLKSFQLTIFCINIKTRTSKGGGIKWGLPPPLKKKSLDAPVFVFFRGLGLFLLVQLKDLSSRLSVSILGQAKHIIIEECKTVYPLDKNRKTMYRTVLWTIFYD